MSSGYLGVWGAGSPAPVRSSVRTLEGRYVVAKNYTMQQVAFQPRQATRLSYVCVDEANISPPPKSSKEEGESGVREVLRRAFLLYNVFDTIYLFDFNLVPFEGRGIFQKRMKFHEHPSVHDVVKLPALTSGDRSAGQSSPHAEPMLSGTVTPARDADTHAPNAEVTEDMPTTGDSVTAETGSYVALPLPEQPKGAKRSLQRPPPLMGAIIGFLSGDLLYVELPGRHKQCQFNEKGYLISQRVNGVKWMPGSTTRFLAWFEGGGCYVYDTTRADVAHSSLKDLKSDHSLRVLSHVVKDTNSNPLAWWRFGRDALHEVAFSPAGTHVAAAVGPYVYLCRMVTGKDGDSADVLVPEPIVVFRSYYGQYLCVAWSPDDRYLAAGGEADTVSVFDVRRGCVVAYGTAHKSWVHRMIFDFHRTASGVYRLLSAGADTSFVVWEVCEADMASVSASPVQPRASERASLSVGSQAQARSGDDSDAEKDLERADARAQVDRGESGSEDDEVTDERSDQASDLDGRRKDVAEGRRSCESGEEAVARVAVAPAEQSWEREGPGTAGDRGSKSRRRVHVISHPAPRLVAEVLPLGEPMRTHVEPLTDIICTPESVVTSCGGGFVKAWVRPQAGFREPHATYECLSDSEDEREVEPPPVAVREDDWEKSRQANQWASASSARSKEPELSAADSPTPREPMPHSKAAKDAAEKAKSRIDSQAGAGVSKSKSKVEKSGPGDAGEEEAKEAVLGVEGSSDGVNALASAPAATETAGSAEKDSESKAVGESCLPKAEAGSDGLS